jgi:hypothetical protein
MNLHPPSSVAVYTQGPESGDSGFETRSGVIPQAALLKCGHTPRLSNRLAGESLSLQADARVSVNTHMRV